MINTEDDICSRAMDVKEERREKVEKKGQSMNKRTDVSNIYEGI